MTDKEIDGKIERIIAILNGVQKILLDFLPQTSGQPIGGMREKLAGELLERIAFNSVGVLHLINSYSEVSQMAIPLSQIYRAMLYEAVISYWLYEDNNEFDERLKSLNGDFLKKMAPEMRLVADENSLQNLWTNWRVAFPGSFKLVNDKLELAKYTRPIFSEICKGLEERNTYPFMKAISKAYMFLSQQAHVSAFSKGPNDAYVGNLTTFEVVTSFVAGSALLLLSKTKYSEDAFAKMIALSESLK